MKRNGTKFLVILVMALTIQVGTSVESEAVLVSYSAATCGNYCFSLSSARARNGQEPWQLYLAGELGLVAIGLQAEQLENQTSTLVEQASFGDINYFVAAPDQTVFLKDLYTLNMPIYDFFTNLTVDPDTEMSFQIFNHGTFEDVLFDNFSYSANADGMAGILTYDYRQITGDLAFLRRQGSLTIAPAPVPEPSTIILLGAGLVGLLAVKLRRRKEE